MASRISGITIEINGDTTKLVSALSGMNKEIGNSQAALKDVNKLLKMDPGNADLIRQKQEYLASAIQSTKEKLQQEKDALEQMKNSGDTEENQAQQNALQREIIETTQKLEALEKQAKESSSVLGQQMEVVGGKIQEVGGKITNVGAGITKGLTAPIAGVAAASVVAWTEIDDALDTVTVKTGATGDALTDMQDRVKNIAETIPTDFRTAGDAVGEVNTRFGLTGDALEKLSTQFVEFAQINNLDVSNSIDSVQAAMAAFEVETEDAGLVLDTLNKAGQDTGISIDKLSQDMTANAAALKEMGFGISDSAMFLANLNKNGIDSSTVMSGLKKAFTNATKDGKTMDEALAELQDTMINSATDTDAYAAAMELFGNKAGPAIAEAVRSGRLSFNEFGTSLDDFAGNVENTFNETLDPLDQMKVSMNILKDVGADLVDTAAPMLTAAMEKIRDVVTTLKEKWDNLSESQKNLVLKIAGVTATVGPLVTATGKVTSGIGSTIGLVGKLIGLFTPVAAGTTAAAAGTAAAGTAAGGAAVGVGAFSTALLPIVGIVAGVVAAGVLLYKNWDTIKEKAGQLKDWLGEKFSDIKEGISKTWDNVKTKASETWDTIKTTVSDKVSSVKDNMKNAWDKMTANTRETLGNMKTAFEENGGGIQGIWAAAVEGVRSVGQQKFDALNQLTGGRLGDMVTAMRSKTEEMRSAAAEKFQAIQTSVSDKVTGIKSAITTNLTNAKTTALNVFEDIKKGIKGKIETARDKVRAAIEKIKSFFNFSWSLPKIKLPHFSIQGKFSLDPPQIPSFGVQWYRKAMDNGMILTSPTIFGAKGGKLLAGGEAGAEAVVGVNSLRNMIQDAVSNSVTNDYGGFVINVYGAQGQDIKDLVDEIERRISRNITRRRAGGLA